VTEGALYSRQKREKRREQGLCCECGAGLAALVDWTRSSTVCPECFESRRQQNRKWRHTARGRKLERNRIRRWRASNPERVLKIRKDAYWRRKVSGICTCCSEPATDGNRCAFHAEMARNASKEYARRKAQERRSAGLCTRCGRPPIPGLTLCEPCRVYMRATDARRRAKDKQSKTQKEAA